MKNYEIGVKHDGGEVVIRVAALSIERAKNLVMDIEKCPARAITFWRVIPTAKQIAKTKSLLRGI